MADAIDSNTPTRALMAEMPKTSETELMTTRELCAQAEYMRRNSLDHRFPNYVVEELLRRVQVLTEAMGPLGTPPPTIDQQKERRALEFQIKAGLLAPPEPLDGVLASLGIEVSELGPEEAITPETSPRWRPMSEAPKDGRMIFVKLADGVGWGLPVSWSRNRWVNRERGNWFSEHFPHRLDPAARDPGRVPMIQRHRAALTEAVNAYARACGGTTEATAVNQDRVRSFITIEKIIREVEAHVRGGVDVCCRCGACLAPVEPPTFCEGCAPFRDEEDQSEWHG